ncbi:MAG: M23 family metallopeptidase [Candidatus Cloacimonetes bacterium]|nr:M23 family metallopeptidase [Candidatus Cloacimonadota bacterium]
MINADNIEIGFFSKKKVIPLNYKMGSFLISNIKMPDLIVRNKRDEKISLSVISIIGINGGKEVIKYSLYKNELKEIIGIVTPQINSLIKDKNTKNSLEPIFGQTVSLERELKSDLSIENQEVVLIPLSLMLYCHYIGLKTIDKLQINITFKCKDENRLIQFPIDLFFYNTKDKYIFPMKGDLCICNLPMNLPQYRKAQSQEFAIDIVGRNFSSSNHTITTNIEDYAIYGADIISIGDGVIVEIGDKFPEIKMDNPNSYTEEYFSNLSSNLIPTIGVKNTLLGNYIIVKHKSDEYSVYAHLKENSICVKLDEEVKQGDLIAKVGNTGHSTEPHLHYQLVDSMNVFEANGLPIIFKNLPIKNMNQHFSNSNSLVNSDYFYVSVE